MRKSNLIVGRVYQTTQRIANHATVVNGYGSAFSYNEEPPLGTRIKCLSLSGGYYGTPTFCLAENKSISFALSSCRGIEPSTEDVNLSRSERADMIRVDIEAKQSELADFQSRVAVLKEEIPKLERQVEMLVKYASDEEALAAIFSEIIKTGGDAEKILLILKEFGVTNKL